MSESFEPTSEQNSIITHGGSAFIAACPGSGKTRLVVERARLITGRVGHGRGVAFLSFTRSAIAELERRLRHYRILSGSAFPNFVGTFDAFVWQFLVAPFPVGANARPRLIPDLHEQLVKPFDKAQPLPLKCFDPQSNQIDAKAAKRLGFDVSDKTQSLLTAYTTTAKNVVAAARKRGYLGYDDARQMALQRVSDSEFGPRLGAALAARFHEAIVDEAQDCNADDLAIVDWLRASGLVIKVICDPNQSIYGFRDGVSHELRSFAQRFSVHEQKSLRGNFRSTANICKAICTLRPRSERFQADEALGKFRDVMLPVEVASYRGASVPSTIGRVFADRVRLIGENVHKSPVVAATRESAAAAIGRDNEGGVRDSTLRLAQAVGRFSSPLVPTDVTDALAVVHQLILEIDGAIPEGVSYHEFLLEIRPEAWRSKCADVIRRLRYSPEDGDDPRKWHARARQIFASIVTGSAKQMVSTKLRWNSGLNSALVAAPLVGPPSRTIHSVKGHEFPCICVVTTSRSLGNILSYLESGEPSDVAEEARKLYVGASRAQKFLTFASPKSQAPRLAGHLRLLGAEVVEYELPSV